MTDEIESVCQKEEAISKRYLRKQQNIVTRKRNFVKRKNNSLKIGKNVQKKILVDDEAMLKLFPIGQEFHCLEWNKKKARSYSI